MVNWTELTKEELLHLITGDLELESLILVHLVTNVKSQREALSGKCWTCESIVKKFAMPVTAGELSKLEGLRLMRWMLHELGLLDDSLNRAQELWSKYSQR